jgi:6-phosphofructokinase 1
VAAEGAKPAGGDFVTAADQQQNREARLGGIGAVVGAEIEKRTGKETRLMVLGHLQRGGSPTYMDRVLCTMFGAKAVELIAEGRFGRMVSHTGKGLRTVPPDDGFVQATRALGICLGD